MENHTAPTASGPTESRDPSAFLSEIIGVPVTVKLNSGVVYKGRLCVTPTQPLRSDMSLRRASIGGWIHEYCAREVSGICQRAAEKDLRRRFRQGKQWWVAGIGDDLENMIEDLMSSSALHIIRIIVEEGYRGSERSIVIQNYSRASTHIPQKSEYFADL
jgi:hypothetical protein